jgi:hypothetical protein
VALPGLPLWHGEAGTPDDNVQVHASSSEGDSTTSLTSAGLQVVHLLACVMVMVEAVFIPSLVISAFTITPVIADLSGHNIIGLTEHIVLRRSHAGLSPNLLECWQSHKCRCKGESLRGLHHSRLVNS